ncbi:hypothetical protein GBAR_LOCUS21429, partial [Geodia barretti]
SQSEGVITFTHIFTTTFRKNNNYSHPGLRPHQQSNTSKITQ